MNKKTLFRAAAMLMAMIMLLSVATGCGNDATTSDTSDGGTGPVGGFTADSQDFNAGDVNGDDSTVSNGSGNNGGGSGNSSQVANSDGLKYSDNVDIFKNIPAELKGKTVLFSDWGEAVADEYQKVVAQFTKDTGIKVKMVQFKNTEYISKVSQQIAAGKAPDIAASNYWFPTALEVVQPLPSYFDVNDGFWDKRVTEAYSAGGKNYFVNAINSVFCTGYMVFYNKTLFNTAGLKTPQEYCDEGAWSWENFKAVAKSCVEAGYKGAIIDPLVIAEQMGETLVEYDPKSGTFSGNATSTSVIKALQYGSVGLEEGVFYNALASSFNQGGIGMTILGTYGLKYDGYFRKMLPSAIGVVPLPDSFEGQKLKYMPTGGRGYGICKGAQNGEAAYYLLRYYLDLDKYAPAGANIFANKALEKYYKQTHLVQFQKSELYYEYFSNPLMLANAQWDSPNGAWKNVKYASSGQITVELTKMKNVLDSAVKLANQKISDFAK